MADGSSHSLAFGDGTQVGFNVFVQSSGGDTVYTTSAGLKDAVNKTLYDLRDRGILSFVQSEVVRVEIDAPDIDATVERQPDPGDGIARWALSEPIEASADTDTVSALVSRLSTGNALAFPTDEPTEEQLDEFGLDAPEITLRLWTDDSAAHTLQIGGSAEDPSGRYARRLGSDAIMIIPDNLAACYVLHRLSVPRHPPNALQRLIAKLSCAGTSPAHVISQSPIVEPAARLKVVGGWPLVIGDRTQPLHNDNEPAGRNPPFDIATRYRNPFLPNS